MWVRTFYWMPVLGRLAKRWMRGRGRYRPAPPPSGGEGWWDEPGVREPRRPSPLAGAGAVALDEPVSPSPDEDGASSVAVALADPEAPTTAA